MEAFLSGPAGISEPFLVHYGDVVTNQDFHAMSEFHRRQNALATLLVHERARSNSIVNIDTEGRIERFLERPTEAERGGLTSSWVFSGVALRAPELLDVIPPGQFSDFPRDIFVRLAGTRKLFAFPLNGKRYAVDSPERLEEARRGVAAGEFRADLMPDNTFVAVQTPLEGLEIMAAAAGVCR